MVDTRGVDFIRAKIADDITTGKFGGRVVTRFPPEPNGYLHIGHAKSICLNFGIAQEYPGARCHLRFDDTNPETEDILYVESIIGDVKWLGFDFGEHLYFASDYFEQFYDFAESLIRDGKAYVDSLNEDEIRAYRGTISEPGRPSPYRDRSIAENLDLLRRMRAGEFPDGAHVLRAKADMASRNMLMRDPLLYRIRHAEHYRRGSDWCIYPLYDYAHPLEDAIECVTHSLCTLEFENNRELYDWVVENTKESKVESRKSKVEAGGGSCRPEQTEFARLELDYTVMSKRKLLELVKSGLVSGWDDPRMPTIAGLRRRGVTPESIRAFCDMIGVAKANSRVDIAKLEYAIRDDLNRRVPRVMCVVRPLRVVVENYPENETEWIDAPYYPRDVPLEGSRPLPFSRVLYIDRDDFSEDPPKGWFRLAPGREVRLRYAYLIRCTGVVKDESGKVVEVRCTYDPESRGGAAPDGRVVKGTLHWLSAAQSLPAEVRLYDRLFTVADPEAEERDFRAFLNPESLVVVRDARIEPGVQNDPAGTRYQFERVGYFCSDVGNSAPGHLVFNRTVGLRDTWARVAGEAEDLGRPTRETATARATARVGGDGASRPEAPARSPSLEQKRRKYIEELGLGEEEADILTRDEEMATLFEAAIAAHPNARGIANWIVNELPRERGDRALSELPFGGQEVAALVTLVDDGTLSGTSAREVLAEMAASGGDPRAIVERRGLRQINDEPALARVIDELLASNPEKVQQYRDGRTGLLGFFIGQAMGRTGGRANPELLKRLLADRLS
jgi:glutaminyl-tRNA synthetase